MMDRVRGTSASPVFLAVVFGVVWYMLRLVEIDIDFYFIGLLMAMVLGWLVGRSIISTDHENLNVRIQALENQLRDHTHPVGTTVVSDDPDDHVDPDDDTVVVRSTTARPV